MTASSDIDVQAFRTAWWQRAAAEPVTYELTRFLVLRLLGLVYLFAFLALALQGLPLLGHDGLLPIDRFLSTNAEQLGGDAFWRIPSLFWLGHSDAVLLATAWTGVALSAAALAGVTNAGLQLALWALYASFVHTGQIFYGYGWEIQLLETGLLAVFLCPWRSVRPFAGPPAPTIVVWLLRWLIFRVMLGAALIKLRGDSCWRDLTCLDFHFETQPNPDPLAWSLHRAPHAVHAAGVLFNHFVELVVPWFAFALRPWRHWAGALLVAFQISLIASGNLSFLNWLTLVPALACFDDGALVLLLPRRLRRPALERFVAMVPSRRHTLAAQGFAVVVAVLSVAPVFNLFSSHQKMNASYDPLAIVNTYGAFGSVDRRRYEVILEGTDGTGPDAEWREYVLPCMPGPVDRRPCVVGPYHYRLDWQMWFVGNGAARGEGVQQEPWLVHLIWQLLRGAPGPKKLFARDPFPGAPPRWIRMSIWHYRFSDSSAGGAWWTRERVGELVPPLSLADESLRDYVRAFGWPDAPGLDEGEARGSAQPPSRHAPVWRRGLGAYPPGRPLHARLISVPSHAHPGENRLQVKPGIAKHSPTAVQAGVAAKPHCVPAGQSAVDAQGPRAPASAPALLTAVMHCFATLPSGDRQ